MNKPQIDDLLSDLDDITDFCIGNQKPTDAGFNTRETLPEVLAYLMCYPENIGALRDARHKVKDLAEKVDFLLHKIERMELKKQLKMKKH
jgi:hypothetical protein